MEDENTKYIRAQIEAGVLPTDVVSKLVQAGWDQIQATQLVQNVSGVQLAVAPPPGVYLKPPIILRIMYIFSFFYLILAIFLAVIAVSALNSAGEVPEFFPYLLLLIAAVLFALFIFIRKLKSGSLLALKIYTALTIISIVVPFIAYSTYTDTSTVAESLGNAVAPNVIPLIIVLYLWIKHRRYFR